MGYLIYNLLLVLASPVLLLVLLSKKRCRPGLRQRLGAFPENLRTQAGSVIWVHAVSLGEVVTVIPLVKALRRHYPHWSIVLSTMTQTGQEVVEKQLAGVAVHFYLPLDFPWAVEAYVKRLRPVVFIFGETELWPNLLKSLYRQGVPTVLINGRLSSRSFKRYQMIGFFMRRVLSMVTMCLMQTERDAKRIKELGADPRRVHRTGNMKFDQTVDDRRASLPELSASSIGLSQDEMMIVAGSTHSEEEDHLLIAYKKLCQRYPSVVLLIAPRYIERAAQVEEKIQAQGLNVVRRSHLDAPGETMGSVKGPRVIILDSRGELARVYGLGYVAFVGGTLSPIGGHNLLEPAQYGKPVLFGPHTDHCSEIANLLIQTGGGIQVQNGEELTLRLLEALGDPTRVRKMGEAAKGVIENNRGVVKRNLELIGSLFEAPKGPRSPSEISDRREGVLI